MGWSADAREDLVAAVAQGSAACGAQRVPHIVSGEVVDSASQGSSPLWAEHGHWGYHTWGKCPATGDLVEGGSEKENIKKPPAHILYLLKINTPCLPPLKPPESPLQKSFSHLAPCLLEEPCHFCPYS